MSSILVCARVVVYAEIVSCTDSDKSFSSVVGVAPLVSGFLPEVIVLHVAVDLVCF